MKALLDSNIVIYALMPEHANLRIRLKPLELHISAITRVEVLGFPGMSQEQYDALRSDFSRYVRARRHT